MVAAVVGVQRQRGVTLKVGRFEALLDHTGWTRKHAAELVGVVERQAYRWQRGESTIPRSAWKVLCDAAGVEMTEDDWRPRTSS